MKWLLRTVIFFVLASPMASVFSEDLSTNIMRRVNSANQSLDKASELIQQNRPELSINHIKGAEKEYENIFNYYGSSFDHNHPTITALKARIDKLTVDSQNKPVEVNRSMPATQNTQAQTVTEASSSNQKTTDTNKPLLSNIVRLIRIGDNSLSGAKNNLAKGNNADHNIRRARENYEQIFKRYSGMFDPNHPDIVAFKARIDDVEKQSQTAYRAIMSQKPVESLRTIVGMPKETADKLRNLGSSIAMFNYELNIAKKNAGHTPVALRKFEDVKRELAEFNNQYGSTIDPTNESYIHTKARFAQAEKDAAALQALNDRNIQAANNAATAKLDAETKAIMSKYENMVPSGTLHANNIGKIVWAKEEIGLNKQDSIKTETTFNITDPIFGRVFLPQSIGNTPVYSQVKDLSAKPHANINFGYEFRLFIDGKEHKVMYDVFTKSKLNGRAGETWTTWQFAPNPIPFDAGFKMEADAWRKSTKDLTPGEHKVRFELWTVSGNFKSRKAISSGEFTLKKGIGDRISAGGQFPKDTHSGNTEAVRTAMKKAMGEKANTIIDIAVTSDWKRGIYSDTKRQYRVISGAILFQDQDNDGVCRFVTYNFSSPHISGDNWGPLKFQSFCMGCPEGDVECPK